MKNTRVRFVLAAMVAALVAAACVREMDVPDEPLPEPGESELSFLVKSGAPVTRSEASLDALTYGGVIDMGMTGEGKPLRFVDSVTGIPLPSSDTVSTKGTPATSENVKSLYGRFYAVAYDGTTPVSIGGESTLTFQYKAISGKWTHVFDNVSPFEGHESLYFFAWMPLKPDGTVFYPSAKTISFSYTVPDDPASQQDLLFAGTATTEAAYNDDRTQPFPVTFHHALCGLKFSIGNDVNSTVIKTVRLKNVVKSGSVVINPETPSVTWTPGSTKTTYTLTDPGVSEASGVKNLDDEDLSHTFWLIPQTLPDDAELEVTYAIAGGADKVVSVKVNEALGSPLTLTAGELHTFSLNPDEVNLTVTDDMASDKIEGIVIRNSGNVDAVLRAVIVANWRDASGDIVAPWDFEPTEFAGLPGTGWVLKSDGFYYTTDPVAAGEEAPALFTSYTPPVTPPVAGSHLVMDVAVQAVNTNPATSWAD